LSSAKEEARKIIEGLPDNATWDDIWYQLYVKRKIDNALQEASEGKVLDHEKVREKFKEK